METPGTLDSITSFRKGVFRHFRDQLPRQVLPHVSAPTATRPDQHVVGNLLDKVSISSKCFRNPYEFLSALETVMSLLC